MVETFFTEKRIIKKIIIAIVFIFMFNFTFSHLGNNVVFAETIDGYTEESSEVTDSSSSDDSKTDDWGNTYMEEGGGKLLLPIQSLLLFISDSILNALQTKFLDGGDKVVLKAKAEEMKKIDGLGRIIVGAIFVAGSIAMFIIPGPGDDAAWYLSWTTYFVGSGAYAIGTGGLILGGVGVALTVDGGKALWKGLTR